ncbi:MAG TPA: FAD-dependent monooxygenase [Patescibacteria group bacterium]
MQKTGVLIIGAGPTGLMMACQLAMQKIPFIIVEKDPASTTESRAIGIQARSLEIFEQMGIADKFVKEGQPAQDIDFVVNGKIVEDIPLSGMGEGLTKFPYLLILEQFKTEKNLLDFLESKKVKVHYDTTVMSFIQDNDKTTAVIQTKNRKKETIEADWIVGADGAHSIVRHTLGIELAGKTYKQSLFVLDCHISSPTISPTHLSVALSSTAFAAIFPMPNHHYRIVGEVPPRLYGKDTITFEDIQSDFAERMQMDIKLSKPYWVSLYHAHHRCVATFKKGRCFLVGDAAHIHSPVGAQGMNTGLQDAYNLAWKLAFVYKKLAKDEILETFNEDRLPTAKKLVETTDRAFNLIINPSKIGLFFRTRIAPKVIKFVLSHNGFKQFIFRTVSQIGISYHSGSLSKNASFGKFSKDAPKPGDRLPYIADLQEKITPTHFHLFIFTKNENMEEIEKMAEQYKNIMLVSKITFNETTKKIYDAFGITDSSYYLVRPDMYIAFRSNGKNEKEFEEYLSRFFIS